MPVGRVGRCLLLVACLAGALPGQAAAPAGELEAALVRLEQQAGDPQALACLRAGGARTLELLLEGFATASATARAQRARLFTELASAQEPVAVEQALLLSRDPSPPVRALALEFLARFEAAPGSSAQRVARLEELAAADPSAELRAQAISALGRIRVPESAAALVRLLQRLPSEEGLLVARAMAVQPSARAQLVGLCVAATASTSPLPRPRIGAAGLNALLAGYGKALAELPGGGSEPDQYLVFARTSLGQDAQLADAGRRALNDFLERCIELGEVPRAVQLLDNLVHSGLDTRDLAFRRAQLALEEEERCTAALRAAEQLARSSSQPDDPSSRRWQAYGLELWAAACLARGDTLQARARLDELALVLDGLIGEQVRRGPSPADSGLGRELAELYQQRALLEVWRLLVLLFEGAEPTDPKVAELARGAHLAALRAQLVDVECDAQLGAGSFDALLGHELGPQRLLFSNPRSLELPRARALELQHALLEAMWCVSPEELPGCAPAGKQAQLAALPVAWRDPTADSARAEILWAVQDAELEALRRAYLQLARRLQAEPGLAAELARLERRYVARAQDIDDARKRGAVRVSDLRPPSGAALVLCAALRAEGRFDEALELAEAVRETFRTSASNEWWLARAELAAGSALSDAGRGEQAEQSLSAGLARLEGLDTSLRAQRAPLAESGDAADVQLLESQIKVLESARASALVALAVNANVKLHKLESARDYFERAYALDQAEFMRVLLACYRARSGQQAEAREALREITVGPQLYYNLACTHALLGESSLALDYLEREFDDNHPSAGSLARQKQWAAEDPDLESLRQNPRFQALVAP